MLGLLTRAAGLVTAVTMVVAVFTAHIDNGLFMANNGYEFALSLLAISLALTLRGAGNLSLDRLFTHA